MFFTLLNKDNIEPTYSKVVPYIDIQIPRIFCENSITEYPLLEIGDMRTSVMKSWIEAFFHIPVEEQELGQIAGNDFLFTLEVINNRETFVPREEIYLNVYSTTNDELRSVYRENNIRTMVPIHVTSFDTDHHWVYHYRGQNVKEFIENTLKIPEDRQRLFHEKFLVNLDQVYGLILRAPDTIEINLAAQVDDGENELLEIVQRLGISRMRSILIKHPVNDSVMFDLPLSKVERIKENWLPLDMIYELIGNESQGLSKSCLYLMRNEEEFKCDFNLHEHFLNENCFSENLCLILLVSPYGTQDVPSTDRFCEEHGLKYIKQVNINFLTGQFTIDVITNKILALIEVKAYICHLKGIPPHLQVLYFDNVNLSDDTKLITLNRSMNRDSIILTLVKPAKEMELRLSGNIIKEQLTVKVLETDYINRLKDIVNEHTGIPSLLINIYSTSRPGVVRDDSLT